MSAWWSRWGSCRVLLDLLRLSSVGRGAGDERLVVAVRERPRLPAPAATLSSRTGARG
jgi:hypothetical protein